MWRQEALLDSILHAIDCDWRNSLENDNSQTEEQITRSYL